MTHIVLTPEQAKIVSAAGDEVEVRDDQGRPVAFLKLLSAEVASLVAEAKRRLANPGRAIPAADVEKHLQRLDEIRQREGMDEARMLDLLRRMQAGEEV